MSDSAAERRCTAFMRPFHRFWYPLVTSVTSHLVVSRTQRFFQLDSESGRSKNALGKLAYVFFCLATSLGEDVYYFLPLLYWYCLPMAVTFSTAFGMVITAGQFVKDVSCLPRPPKEFKFKGKNYYIAKLENHYNTEYGLPSTHAMSGSLIFVILMKMERLGLLDDRGPYFIPVVGTFATLSCALSRLYMGVHSIYDVIFGLFLAAAVQLFVLIPYGEDMDLFLYQNDFGIIATLLIILWFTTLYPKTNPWSASWGTASQLFGVYSGSAMGLYYIFLVKPELAAILSQSSLLHVPIKAWNWPTLAKKTALGLSVILVTREVAKRAAQAFTKALLKAGVLTVPKGENIDTEGKPVPMDKLYVVEVPTRLMSYGLMSIAMVVLAPMSWKAAGLA